MDEQQLTDIRIYLLDKKLPIDILVEVYDHFISQISELQKEEGLGFDEAFAKVKNSWQDELRLYWNGSWDLHNNSRFLRKMYLIINRGILKKMLSAGGAVILALFITAQISNAAVFRYLLSATMVLLTIFPLVHYLRHRADYDLAKKYNKYVLMYYQHSSAMFFSTFALLLPNLDRIYHNSDPVLAVFRFSQSAVGIEDSAFFWSVFLFIIFGNTLMFIIQMNYLTQIHKVKPFLKFLKPSR